MKIGNRGCRTYERITQVELEKRLSNGACITVVKFYGPFLVVNYACKRKR